MLDWLVQLLLFLVARYISQMVTMGDGEVVHDVWLLSDKSVYLCIGRNQKKRKAVVSIFY